MFRVVPQDVGILPKLRILTCRVDKETLARTLLATQSHLCALGPAALDVLPNLVKLSFGHLVKGVRCGWYDLYD